MSRPSVQRPDIPYRISDRPAIAEAAADLLIHFGKRDSDQIRIGLERARPQPPREIRLSAGRWSSRLEARLTTRPGPSRARTLALPNAGFTAQIGMQIGGWKTKEMARRCGCYWYWAARDREGGEWGRRYGWYPVDCR